MKLSNDERETIITFNEVDKMASIFTYNKSWQKHIEVRLGFKPSAKNNFGGREYEVPKKMLRPPKAPVKLSRKERMRRAEVLARARFFEPERPAKPGVETKKQNHLKTKEKYGPTRA